MKVMLIDDHLLEESGVRTILERYYSPVTIVSACDCHHALELIQSDRRIDLILYNLGSADIKAYQGLRHLIGRLENIPVVVLLVSENPTVMREILALGVQGCIARTVSNDVMACAIRMVLAGDKYVPFAALSLPDQVPESHEFPERESPPTSLRALRARQRIKLSTRQIQVLRLVIEGKTNKEIGRMLGISETTARAHITAIFKALDVSNRTQACYVAAQLGLWSVTPIVRVGPL